MNPTNHGTLRAGVVLTVVVVATSFVAAQHHHSAPGAMSPSVAQPQPAAKPQAAATPQPARQNLPTLDARLLSAAQEAVARAIGHAEAGHPQDAVKELKQVQASLAVLRQTIDRGVAPSFANDHCPIMGTPIDVTKVPAALARTCEGHKVAFCCAGCPQTWDRLASPERATKLVSVILRPQ